MRGKGDILAKNWNAGIISYSNRVVALTVVVMHPARYTLWQGAVAQEVCLCLTKI